MVRWRADRLAIGVVLGSFLRQRSETIVPPIQDPSPRKGVREKVILVSHDAIVAGRGDPRSAGVVLLGGTQSDAAEARRVRGLVYHAMIWQFHEAKPCVVAGIPSIRVFGIGDDQESAISDLESLLFMIQERVVKSRQPQTPLIVTLKSWFSERIN
jgi:hypothetical protein